jgi:hypothetical protein
MMPLLTLWLIPCNQAGAGSLLARGLAVSRDCERLDLGYHFGNLESAFPPSASATLLDR